MRFKVVLLCKVASINGRNSNVVIRLNARKIKVKLDKDALINLEYDFLQPMTRLNVSTPIIRYQRDSGSYFFAPAKGNMDEFAKSIGATSVFQKQKILFLRMI